MVTMKKLLAVNRMMEALPNDKDLAIINAVSRLKDAFVFKASVEYGQKTFEIAHALEAKATTRETIDVTFEILKKAIIRALNQEYGVTLPIK